MAIAYSRAGSGPALVLIHGLGGSRRIWEPVLDRLGAERDVVAVDLPGFGDSDELPGGIAPTPVNLGAAVADLCVELGLGRYHLAGNSLGAWVAIELARQGRGLSVTGLAPAGFWKRPLGPRTFEPHNLARVVLPFLPLLSRTARGRRALLSGSVAHPDRVPADAARRLVRAYATSPAFVRANAAMRAAIIEHLDELEVPVTLAWAEFDRLVKEPRGGVPGARSVRLRGCGHIPTWDDPDQVAALLLETSSAR
jgi:pimeloyl-ACP methyl ester carboxylesterase